ncbi:MAG TPA: hypothetical protein VMZ28_25790 [Kofleriaceae bacterium]|nr:hypothetical protein [Kofleriaceae bacterium]
MRRSLVALTLLAALLGLGVVTSCIVRSRPAPAHSHRAVQHHDHGKHQKHKKHKKHR